MLNKSFLLVSNLVLGVSLFTIAIPSGNTTPLKEHEIVKPIQANGETFCKVKEQYYCLGTVYSKNTAYIFYKFKDENGKINTFRTRGGKGDERNDIIITVEQNSSKKKVEKVATPSWTMTLIDQYKFDFCSEIELREAKK